MTTSLVGLVTNWNDKVSARTNTRENFCNRGHSCICWLCLIMHKRKIAVCFLGLSLPGHYRVTDGAFFLAETKFNSLIESHLGVQSNYIQYIHNKT